jgi:hypothetical protein
MPLESGFYAMSAAEYHGDPAPQPSLSHSIAMAILDNSPFYAWFYNPRFGGNVKPATREMDNGTVAHLMLTGHGREVGIVAQDSYRKATARIERDSIRAKGRTPVLEKDYKIAEDMVRTARQALGTMEQGKFAFDPKYGYCELAALNRDAAGVWTRCLIDFYGATMPSGVECWDYKTTSGSANPVMLRSHMSRMGWALQAAMQERIISQLKPELAGRLHFRFLVQETEAPFLCSVVAPAESAMVIAHKMVSAAISIWKECIETDVWPAYPATPVELGVQPWVEAGWLSRELEFEQLGKFHADPWLNTAAGAKYNPPVMPELSAAKREESPQVAQRAIVREPTEQPQRAADGAAALAHPAAATGSEPVKAPQRAVAKRKPGRPRKPAKPPPEAEASDERPPYEPPKPQRVDM